MRKSQTHPEGDPIPGPENFLLLLGKKQAKLLRKELPEKIRSDQEQLMREQLLAEETMDSLQGHLFFLKLSKKNRIGRNKNIKYCYI